ncbi:MAG TPA: hypothetical protein VL527_15195 [Dongiaceae bacterium]|nr:hypothetical protein [Dongiaceae bacterium]
MVKFVLGILVGGLLATLCLVTFISKQFAAGLNSGNIAGRLEAANALQQEFGTNVGAAPHRVLFSVKTTDVVVIETNGIKTVRVIP